MTFSPSVPFITNIITPNPIPQYISSICYLWINFKQKYNLWSHIIFINWIQSWMDIGKKFITVNIQPDFKFRPLKIWSSPHSLATVNKSCSRKLQTHHFATSNTWAVCRQLMPWRWQKGGRRRWALQRSWPSATDCTWPTGNTSRFHDGPFRHWEQCCWCGLQSW